MPFSLSIVIPSQKRTDLLAACLRSIQAFMPAGTDVIVIDDCSWKGIVSKLAESFMGVRVLRLPRTSGFCRAANAGVEAATGDIVELLNDDTEVSDGWATAALRIFENTTVAAVAPLVLTSGAGEARIDSAGDRYYVGGIAGKRGHGARVGPDYLRSCRVFGASASSAFYRRAALERVGGFPEHFGAYFEDVDLAFRLNRAGYQVWYEPAARVFHHGGASYGTVNRRLLERQSCNEERVFWRNIPLVDMPAALPRHAAVVAAKAWRRWRDGGLAPFVCGRLRVLGDIGSLIRHRRWLRSLGPAANLGEVERRCWEGMRDEG